MWTTSKNYKLETLRMLRSSLTTKDHDIVERVTLICVATGAMPINLRYAIAMLVCLLSFLFLLEEK